MQKVRILECTLRDGSYVINFQFTEGDTKTICKALEDVGFDMIEVGHGIGLGASEKGKGIAAESDETYLRAAAETVKKADWGMFCIPGIAELKHVDLAGEYNMKFIRIGTNVEDYQESKPFIERAKKYGMFVCSNFMKSYVSSPEELTKCALEVKDYGSDLVYLVDSAGGMFPEDIERYVTDLKQKAPDLKLGFHGHNNLGMGVANAMKSAELGVDIVDTSMLGFGRSGGNVPTEQFLCSLMRHGVDMNIDPVAVMNIAEQYIQPLMRTPALSSVDIVAGLALFHSSYMPVIEEMATKYRVDPRRLIVAVAEKDKVNAAPDLVEEQAKRLSDEGIHGNWKPLYQHYYGGEQDK